MRHLTWLTAASAALVLMTGTAWGQYQIQQGQALDANKRLGSGGLNQPKSYAPGDMANRIVTGNVAGGLSFRAYSPIRDPGSFFAVPQVPQGSGLLGANQAGLPISGVSSPAYLPSDALYTFQRDSYNLRDYGAERANAYGGVTPYYSPSSTAISTGSVVAGQNRLGVSPVQNPYQAPANSLTSQHNNLLSSVQDSVAAGNLLAVPNRVVRTVSGQPVTGPVDYRLMSNPLFAGAFREVAAPEIAGQAMVGQGRATPPAGRDANVTPRGPSVMPGYNPAAPPAQLEGPVDLRVKPSPQDVRIRLDETEARKFDVSADSRLKDVLARATQDGEYTAGKGNGALLLGRTQLLGPKPGEAGAAGGAKPGAGTGRSGDLYAWMQHQVELRAMTGGPAGQPGGTVAPPAGAAPVAPMAAAAVAQAMANREPGALPLKTFVGTESSALNTQLKYAEDAMRTGRYYRASEAYALARSVAPDNPLPALGQGVALLAAGDYVSSASNLFDSIRLFNSLSEFEVDLKSFVPDFKVMDSRRADLEKRLMMRDNGRLRFLLGFAEYNSGFKQLGVKEMENGMLLLTDQDADITAVRRFVEGLQAKLGAQRPVAAPSPK